MIAASGPGSIPGNVKSGRKIGLDLLRNGTLRDELTAREEIGTLLEATALIVQ